MKNENTYWIFSPLIILLGLIIVAVIADMTSSLWSDGIFGFSNPYVLSADNNPAQTWLLTSLLITIILKDLNFFFLILFLLIIYLVTSKRDNNYNGNKSTNIEEENKFLEKLNETTDFRIKRWKESRALEENRQSHISQDLEVNETTEDTEELEIKSSKTIDVPNELRESTAQEKTSIEYSDTYSLHKNIENFKGKQTEKNKKEVDKQEEIVNTDEITEEKISEKYNSIVDELTKLGKLKEKGLLTEEEFNEQKKKFLKQ